MHTPVEVTEDALAEVERVGADCLVALGGGSTIGLAKAIALRTDLPQIAIPTTYAGSEMTPILGETKDGRKTTQRTMKVLPEVVIYDVDLTMTLPKGLSGTSGINAIAHSVEALYAEDANPIIGALAEQSIAALGRALPRIAASPERPRGALRCAIRRLPRRRLPRLGRHGAAPQALPHARRPVRPAAFRDAHDRAAACAGLQCAGRAQGGRSGSPGRSASTTLRQASSICREKVGAPRSLREIGMPERGIDEATDLALANPYWNPRPLERQGIRDLIARAWAGEGPRVQADSAA